MKMKQLKRLYLQAFAVLLIGSVGFLISCSSDGDKDDDGGGQPTAIFSFAISETNFLEVTFTNVSLDYTSSSWDFGDGNTSTDASPTHTYAAAGAYEVTLTVSNDGGDQASQTQTVTISDPNQQLTLLAGTTSKTWYLQREGIALGIGPSLGDNAWWSFGGVTPLGDRPCILDDTYTFHADGTWEFNSGGTIFVDAEANGGWVDAESCYNEDEAGLFDGGRDDFASGGAYTFELDGGTQKITVSGSGNYIGLPVKTNNGDNSLPVAEKVYDIIALVDGDGVDSLHIGMIQPDGASWNFYLVSYDNIADLPPIPGPAETRMVTFKVDMNKYEGTFTQMYVSGTFNGWSGDGDPMDDTDADGIWELTKEIAAGDHQYKFTIDNWAVQEEWTETIEGCVVADGEFFNRGLTVDADKTVGPFCFNSCEACPMDAVNVTLEDLQGTTWSIPAEAGALYVGPGIGSPDWFSIDQAWIDASLCLFDDTFTFGTDDSYTMDVGAEMFTEGHMEGIEANGCVAVADVPANLQAWTGGTFTYSFAMDGDIPKLSVTGNGAYIGFYKGANGSEPTAPSDGTITYEIIAFDGTSMTVSVDISGGQDRSAAWTAKLVKQ